jgi:hypothetical protein
MSGWKTARFHVEGDVDGKIESYCEGNEYASKRGLNGIVIRGYDAEIKKAVRKIIPGEEGKVLIVEANDTSDSGDAFLYEITEDYELEHVETKRGYEGARGYDAIGYMRDEYDVDAPAGP